MKQVEIFILIESPLSERDYWRFGIEQLSKLYKVVILDCTPWLRPKFWDAYKHLSFKCRNHFFIKSGLEISNYISNPHRTIVIDHLGSDREVNSIRTKLRASGIIRAIVLLGPIPVFFSHHALLDKFKIIFSHGITNTIKLIRFYILNKFKNNVVPAPDIALCSGHNSASKEFLQAIPNVVWAHSFDYEIFRSIGKICQNSESDYAVFLDEDMAFHSDFMHHGIPSPVTSQAYFSSMRNFFIEFEKNTGIKIIIAAHPRSNPDLTLLHWKDFEIHRGDAPRLVMNAKIVFCHQTTSISFAILYQKPIIFLTSNELVESWLGDRISKISKLLKSRLLNINNLDELAEWNNIWDISIDHAAYLSYRNDYIKTNKSEELELWQIFIKFINKYFQLAESRTDYK